MQKSRGVIDTSHLACYHSFAIVPQTETQNAGKEMVNMKRLLALLLAAVLALSLVACGNNESSESKESDTTTKEELLEVAEEKSFSDLDTANEAKLDTYVGDIYKISGYISSIESDYLVIQEETPVDGPIDAAKFCIHVYLDTEVLAELDSWENITVVGEITNTGTETMDAFQTDYERLYLDMENAYII